MSNIELSAKQESIVYAELGPICVKASAGSGKTRVLTQRTRHLLALSNKKVLALTFTNRAGQEIRERLKDIEDLDARAFIGTFHSFCQSILENHGKFIGYSSMPHIFEDEADRLELIERAISQIPTYLAIFKTKQKKEQKDFCYRALNFISKIKRNLISELDIEEHAENEDVVLLYRSYQEILRSQNAIDFDDLLLKAYSLIIDHPKVAALYRRSFFGICVDEAQDLNNAQYQFIKAIAGSDLTNIMMVGDPNQSIFHFTGSSAEYMNKQFVHEFSAQVYELKENFRSSVSVLEAARQIIPEAEYEQNTVKKGIFELHKIEDEHEEAKWVASKIRDIVALGSHNDIEGKVTYEKIAVLARNRYLFKPLEEEFQSLGVAYFFKMTPGALKFESALMQIFDLALKIKLNPQDTLHKNRLCKLLKLNDFESCSLVEISEMVKDSEYEKILNLVLTLDEEGRNFKKQLEQYRSDVELNDDGEKNMLFNDINHLLVHWHSYAKSVGVTSIHQFKNAMALGQTQPISQHAGVTLSTVHTMKGQEFDIVFIIGLDDDTFPDYRAVRKGGVELTQEKNNLYVAFTRAKRWLFVSYPEKRHMPWGDTKQRNISRFLKNFNLTGTRT